MPGIDGRSRPRLCEAVRFWIILEGGAQGGMMDRRWSVKERRSPQDMGGMWLVSAQTGRLGVKQDLRGEENQGSVVDILVPT